MAIGRGIGRGLRGYGQSVVDPNTRRASGSATFSTFTASGSADAAKSASGSATFDTFTGAGSGTVGAASPLTLDLQTSRISGVAPLAVFFDGSGTTSTGVTRPFHYLGYEWDFDDAGSYLPTATGPCSAHVFETPGTYTVTMTVTNEDGDTDFTTVDITVTDPDTVYSGTATICCSTSGTFTGAPSGCTQVTSSDLDSILTTYAADNVRLLFRRGETFAATGATTPVVTQDGIYFGAFGTGTSPDARGIYTNNPILSYERGVVQETILAVVGDDIRICELTAVEGDVEAQDGLAFDTKNRCVDLVMHHCKTTGFRSSMGLAHDIIEYYAVNPFQACTISQCWFEDGRNTTTYTSGRQLAILGCYYDANSLSHLCRITFAQKCVIQGNLFEYPGATRHAIKLHAAQTKATYGDYTEQVVISDNEIRATTAWPITIAPQDAGPNDDERLRDVILERNIVIAEANVQVGYYLSCIQSTCRDNVLVRPEGIGTADLIGFYVVRRGPSTPVPSEIEILNNTMHDASAGGEQTLLTVDNYTGSELIHLYNNVINTPGTTTFLIYPGGSGYVDSQGNSSNPSPANFADPSTFDFHPTTGSALLGAGVAAPVFYDFVGTARVNDDVGAYERA